jgi:hypothetical protein
MGMVDCAMLYLIATIFDSNSFGMLSMEIICFLCSELSAVVLLKLTVYCGGNFHMAPVAGSTHNPKNSIP